MKKKIDDPTHPKGYYYGYDSAADCLADYDAELGRRRASGAEAVAGYTCFWVFLAAVVVLSVLAGVFNW
jgi:hypothetical protein